MGLKSLPSSCRNMSETDSRSGVFFNMPRLERFFSLHAVYYCNCRFISHARAERGVKQLPITSSSLRSSLAGLNWHLTITGAILDYSLSSGCIIMSRSSSSGFISSDGKKLTILEDNSTIYSRVVHKFWHPWPEHRLCWILPCLKINK